MEERNEYVGCDGYDSYKYYNIIDYETCCTCPHFSDNWREERLECLEKKCPKLAKNETKDNSQNDDNYKEYTDDNFFIEGLFIIVSMINKYNLANTPVIDYKKDENLDLLFSIANIVNNCNDENCASVYQEGYGKNKDLELYVCKENYKQCFIKTKKNSKLVDEIHNVNIKDKSLVRELYRIYNYENFEVRMEKMEKARQKIEEYLQEDNESIYCTIHDESICAYWGDKLQFKVERNNQKWYVVGNLNIDYAVEIQNILKENELSQ